MSRPLLLALALATGAAAFAPPHGSQLARVARGVSAPLEFGFNGLGSRDDDDEDEDGEKKGISSAGLLQMITAGMGAPFLGDYQGTDEDGKLMFSLEANNLVDEDGNSKQTQMPYFENGWVEEDDAAATGKKGGGGFKLPWQK